MKVPRILRLLAAVVLALFLVSGSVFVATWMYLHPHIDRTNGVIYGMRHGQNLGFDVLRPRHANGLGVLVMVSGGWKSAAPGSFRSWMAAPLLRRGYTIFPVYHLSQPKATVMEITEDVSRAVRFIRFHAADYHVNSRQLGITGGSAGGHLSLWLATRGGPGLASASDPVDRESSSVQAVAIFFPVTDLLNLGRSTENLGDGGPPKSFVKAFGPQSTNLSVWKVIGHEMSPIYYVNSNLPPILIYHGDADTLVPLDQSERFAKEAALSGCDIKVVVHPGGRHGWLTMLWDVRQFAAWFDRHLAGERQASGSVVAPSAVIQQESVAL